MELVDGIAWTDGDRALVYASRRRPNPAYLRSTVQQLSSVKTYAVPIVEEEWAAEVHHYLQHGTTAVAAMRAKLAANPAHWRPAVEAAIDRAATLQGPLEVDPEAVLVALEVCPLFAAMPYWIAREGIAFALRALVRCHQIVGDSKLHGYGSGNFVIERPWVMHGSYATAWHLLRGSLADAIEPAYDEALLAADGLRLEAGAMLRGLLAFAFPDETAWTEHAAPGMIEIAESTPHGYTPALARYVSVAPLAVANQIVGCTTNTALARADLLTMLAFRGAAGGVKVIDTAVRSASSHDVRKEYARVLIIVHTSEAAEVLDGLGGFAPNALMPIKRMHAKAMAKAMASKKKPTRKT